MTAGRSGFVCAVAKKNAPGSDPGLSGGLLQRELFPDFIQTDMVVSFMRT